MYTADQGTVVLDGKDITKLEQYKITRLGMGRTFQNIRLFKGLTVEENVMCAFDPQSRYSIVGGLLPPPSAATRKSAGASCAEIPDGRGDAGLPARAPGESFLRDAAPH